LDPLLLKAPFEDRLSFLLDQGKEPKLKN